MVFDVKAAHPTEPDRSFRINAKDKTEAARLVKEQGFYPFDVCEATSTTPSSPANQPNTESDDHSIGAALKQINTVIVDKDVQVKLAITCLLADGHLLIDDIPGVGKTTFGHAIAKSFGLEYKRTQFTSDLLPADVLGVSIFDPAQASFRFHPGAIFTQVMLADELNRASAKTQSALLEAMEEQQVTVDGQSHPLPEPFFIIATQNPQEYLGTNPLPESQIDRFAVRITLGYPRIEVERDLWRGLSGRAKLEQLQPLIEQPQLAQFKARISEVFVSDALFQYLEDIVQHTRHCGLYVNGLSPRAALMLLKVTRAWALIHNRDYATPEDMQSVLPYVAAHRLKPLNAMQSIAAIYKDLLSIAIP